MGNFLGRHNEMPITNNNNDSTQVSGFNVANKFYKDGDEDNKANSSAHVTVNTGETKEAWQYDQEKNLVKFAMGTVIAIQTLLLLWALAGWALAYRRAKRSMKKLLEAQQQYIVATQAPLAGASAPPPAIESSFRRSRSHRDEERIHQTNITYHPSHGVSIPTFGAPPAYNIRC